MMTVPREMFRLPYGKGHLSFSLPDGIQAEVIVSREIPVASDPVRAVGATLSAPVGSVDLADFRGARSAAIAINDKTRPVPHQHLLPPLLRRLEELGLPPEAITLIIQMGLWQNLRGCGERCLSFPWI